MPGRPTTNGVGVDVAVLVGDAVGVDVGVAWSVLRSSQYGKIVYKNNGDGKQMFVNEVLLLANCTLPFELTLAVVKV